MRSRRNVVGIIVALLVAVFLNPLPSSPASAADSINPVPVFRFYKTDGSHFFTTNESEKSQLERIGVGYRYEGIAFYSFPSQVAGTVPVYRFYNFRQGVHFYTSNQAEFENVRDRLGSTYRYEGVAHYAFPSLAAAGSGAEVTAVYRAYKVTQGVHFYTSDIAEKNAATFANRAYRDEGVAFWVPTRLTFSGSGTASTESFILPNDLVIISWPSTNQFEAHLISANTGDDLGEIASTRYSSEQRTMSYPFEGRENRYRVSIVSDAPWTISLSALPSAVLNTSYLGGGAGATATPEFILNDGSTRPFSYTTEAGDGYEIELSLFDSRGRFVKQLVGPGPNYNGSGVISGVPAGRYTIGAETNAPWRIYITGVTG